MAWYVTLRNAHTQGVALHIIRALGTGINVWGSKSVIPNIADLGAVWWLISVGAELIVIGLSKMLRWWAVSFSVAAAAFSLS